MRSLDPMPCVAAAALAVWVAVGPPAAAQGADPHIGYVFPAGGRRGSTFEARVGGQHLNGVRGARVTGTGLRTTFVRHVIPLTRGQLNKLRQKLRALQRARRGQARARGRRRRVDPELIARAAQETGLRNFDVQVFLDYQKKLRDPKRQPNPQIGETVTLRIRIAADAPPGNRELRLVTPRGLTNPIVFQVGQWREYGEQEPNDREADPGIGAALPVTVNGQILPGDVDRFAFTARKGRRIVVAVAARQLDPYLADAVPGWFQATLAIYDEAGKRVAYADDYRFHPDPALCFRPPADGRYVLEIKDAIYRGREDFVYRISVGRIPFVTDVFPLGGRAGARTTVEVAGWNLPVTRVDLDARGRQPGLVSVAVRSGTKVSNPLPFRLDDLPEVREVEPNDDVARAQEVDLPLVVNGRIGRPGDRDVYRFRGRAGQVVVAEVEARRLGSPLDSLLELRDGQGRRLAVNDDFPDAGAGLTTHQADSRLAVELPHDGSYSLHLSDAQHQGGPPCAYRLRIGPERPDFAVRVVPATINTRPGMTVPLTVHVLRRDGFAGEVRLGLADGLPDFVLSGGRVPAGQDKVGLTLTVPRRPPAEPFDLRLVGRATIHGQEVVRPAVPAQDMMQAFLYRHLVPADDLLVTVSGRARFGPPLRLVGPTPVQLAAGAATWVRITGPRTRTLPQIALELREAPKGIEIDKVVPQEQGGLAVLLRTDPKKARPGLQGNLLVQILLVRNIPRRGGRPARTRRIPVGFLPAIPYEVVRGDS